MSPSFAVFEELPDEDGIGGRVKIYLNNDTEIVVSPGDCLYLGFLNNPAKQCFKITNFYATGKEVGQECLAIRGESQLKTGPMIDTLFKGRGHFEIILGTCSCTNGGGKRKSRKSKKRKTLKRK
jgi:hypothetical protein